MDIIASQIAAAEKRCRKLAKSRNREVIRQRAISKTDPNYYVLQDVIDSLEIQYARTQGRIHFLESLRRARA